MERCYEYNAKNTRNALREALHIIVSRETSGERAIAHPDYKENEAKIRRTLDTLQDEQVMDIIEQVYPTINHLKRKAVNTVYHLTKGSERLRVTDLPIAWARGASVFVADGLRYAQQVGRLDGLLDINSFS